MPPKEPLTAACIDHMMERVGDALACAHTAKVSVELEERQTAIIGGLWALMNDVEHYNVKPSEFEARYNAILQQPAPDHINLEAAVISPSPRKKPRLPSLSKEQKRLSDLYLGKFIRIYRTDPKQNEEGRVVDIEKDLVIIDPRYYYIGPRKGRDVRVDMVGIPLEKFEKWIESGKLELIPVPTFKDRGVFPQAEAEYAEDIQRDIPCSTLRQIMESEHTGRILRIFSDVRGKTCSVEQLLDDVQLRKEVLDFIEKNLAVRLTPDMARTFTIMLDIVDHLLKIRENDLLRGISGEALFDVQF